MQRISDTPSGLRQSMFQAVEIKLWETYVLRTRNNLNNVLSAYSLDSGPLKENLRELEKVLYRFTKSDWEKTIKPSLTNHAVPYEVVREFKIEAFPNRNRKKVYIAEDDLDILFALNTMLENAGYDVLMAHCGKPMMENKLPDTDVFILDNKMPDIDGLDICRHLRTKYETMNTPVVMISANGTIARKAKEAGVNDFLEKPFDMQDLLRIVSKYTSRVIL